ncbi:ATP-binding protein [Macrococcus equipercicus]|uniref:ATP-binding protein n=1 Tax=Macrococcus equipercicus TaxID=69967 RepID=UPI001FEAA951|nr:ATP-binding protein [Macrococcus equipercicus]
MTTVLIILSIALVSFFNAYFISETGNNLYQNATKIEQVLMSRHNQQDSLDYAKELIENPAGLIIIKSKAALTKPFDDPLKQMMVDQVRTNKDYKKVFEQEQHVTKTINVQYQGELHRYILLGFPSQAFNTNGAIILYQDINSISDTIQYICLIILIVTLLLIILTTIFAFFLSTRITKPLLLLKDSAFKVARGEQTGRLDTQSRDEIGELTVAFNKMEQDIRRNISSIKAERNVRDKLIDAMADGVLSYNLDIEAQLKNPMADRFLALIDDEAKAVLTERFNAVTTLEQTETYSVTAHHHHFVIIISPVKTNQKIGAVALIRDMTEEYQNDEMKKRFIANVSHELRTPIQMLQGYTEALLDGIGETKEERDEFLYIILDESKRLNRMVNELLNVARYDAGSNEMLLEDVQVKSLFDKVATNFNQRLSDNGVQLTVEVDDELHWRMDYDKMIQVLTNLIDNAIRYTHAGDKVMLQAAGDDVLEMIVMDTGVGIAASHLPHIFDRFYKVDAARTRGNHGTGLGLFIVQAIVQSHGGTITVASEAGQGTKFMISIPKH